MDPNTSQPWGIIILNCRHHHLLSMVCRDSGFRISKTPGRVSVVGLNVDAVSQTEWLADWLTHTDSCCGVELMHFYSWQPAASKSIISTVGWTLSCVEHRGNLRRMVRWWSSWWCCCCSKVTSLKHDGLSNLIGNSTLGLRHHNASSTLPLRCVAPIEEQNTFIARVLYSTSWNVFCFIQRAIIIWQQAL